LRTPQNQPLVHGAIRVLTDHAIKRGPIELLTVVTRFESARILNLVFPKTISFVKKIIEQCRTLNLWLYFSKNKNQMGSNVYAVSRTAQNKITHTHTHRRQTVAYLHFFSEADVSDFSLPIRGWAMVHITTRNIPKYM